MLVAVAVELVALAVELVALDLLVHDLLWKFASILIV